MAVPDSPTFRPARLDEVELLNELTARSALSWGYEPEFLDWEPEAIRVSEELIASSVVVVLEHDDRVIGYYALTGKPPEMDLDKLFVEPEWIGTGRGKILWQHAVTTARGLGVTTLHLASDPNAAPFYRAMGAVWQSSEPTTRAGWELQMFRFDVPQIEG